MGCPQESIHVGTPLQKKRKKAQANKFGHNYVLSSMCYVTYFSKKANYIYGTHTLARKEEHAFLFLSKS